MVGLEVVVVYFLSLDRCDCASVADAGSAVVVLAGSAYRETSLARGCNRNVHHLQRRAQLVGCDHHQAADRPPHEGPFPVTKNASLGLLCFLLIPSQPDS